MKPSFIGGAINGLLMMIVIIYVIVFWGTLGNYERIVLMSLIAILIGIDAIIHGMQEVFYDFNPLEGKWSGSFWGTGGNNPPTMPPMRKI